MAAEDQIPEGVDDPQPDEIGTLHDNLTRANQALYDAEREVEKARRHAQEGGLRDKFGVALLARINPTYRKSHAHGAALILEDAATALHRARGMANDAQRRYDRATQAHERTFRQQRPPEGRPAPTPRTPRPAPQTRTPRPSDNT